MAYTVARARRRIAHLMRHTYTRVPSTTPDPSTPLDEYGEGLPTADPPTLVSQPCLYEDSAGQVLRTDHGVEIIDTPLLYVPYGDPLASGDHVQNVMDPRENRVFVSSAVVDIGTGSEGAGPLMYTAFRLREIVFP